MEISHGELYVLVRELAVRVCVWIGRLAIHTISGDLVVWSNYEAGSLGY